MKNSTKLATAGILTALFTGLIWLVVLAGVAVILTFLLLALIAAPSFWTAFWFVLVALVVFIIGAK